MTSSDFTAVQRHASLKIVNTFTQSSISCISFQFNSSCKCDTQQRSAHVFTHQHG